MIEKNEDGLIPGQSVDWETLVRIKSQPKPEPEPAKRGRPPGVKNEKI
jgi:hypothetical protein